MLKKRMALLAAVMAVAVGAVGANTALAGPPWFLRTHPCGFSDGAD